MICSKSSRINTNPARLSSPASCPSIAAASAFFAGFEQHWGTEDLQKRLNHPTPAVQFLTVLRGIFSITATDGETRQLHAGEVLRLEDTSPCMGHITVVGDQPGFLMFAR